MSTVKRPAGLFEITPPGLAHPPVDPEVFEAEASLRYGTRLIDRMQQKEKFRASLETW
jgi:hypothetical protein